MSFPETELLDLNNQSHTLSSLIEKEKLNLILFYNTNCLGCTGRAIPLAYKLSQEYKFISLLVIHSNFRIASFDREEILSVFTDQKSPFEIYREEKNELYSHFDCEGTPHWLLVNGEGEMLHSFFGSQDGAQLKLEYAIREFETSE
ncbi:MAG TPA: hypothetical protein VKX31_03300 [Brumimicrobium sp.]|nr:hypothetical protein [Brumimicrobium sp.]